MTNVRVSIADGHILVANSQHPNGTNLRFRPDQWAYVLDNLRRGDSVGQFKRLDDGGWDWVQSTDHGTAVVSFTDAEWTAFLHAVDAGEFDLHRLAVAE
jgi:hypothetical protein